MEYVSGALLLHELGKPVNEENLKKVIEATGSTVDEAKVKVLVASLKDVDIDKELETATLTTPTAATPAGEEEKSEKAKEEKKEEKKSEAAEGLSSLFG